MHMIIHVYLIHYSYIICKSGFKVVGMSWATLTDLPPSRIIKHENGNFNNLQMKLNYRNWDSHQILIALPFFLLEGKKRLPDG
jgi:hypothetical protein